MNKMMVAKELTAVAKLLTAGDRKLVFKKSFRLQFTEADMLPYEQKPENVYDDILYDWAKTIHRLLEQKDIMDSCEVEVKTIGSPHIQVTKDDEQYSSYHYDSTVEISIFVPWFDESSMSRAVDAEVARFTKNKAL